MIADRFAKIGNLIVEYNLELRDADIPNHLKCVYCKSVLKDACQVPCGCKSCRSCIDNRRANGTEFCQGEHADCKESPLSHFVPDYQANKKISNLIAKCPHDECTHECALASIEDHLRVCSRRNVKCPFHELGCKKNLLTEEINAHLQGDNWSHTKILIEMISNLNNDVASLTRNQQNSKKEMESIVADMRKMKEENTSIKQENKLLKDKNDDWSRQFGISLDNGMKSLKSHLESTVISIESGFQAKMDWVDAQCEKMMRQLQVRGAVDGIAAGADGGASEHRPLVNADFLWPIALVETRGGMMESDCFVGLVRPYRYRLRLWCYENERQLGIRLYIQTGPSDSELAWPFSGTVTIGLSGGGGAAASGTARQVKRISQHCQIDNPRDNCFGRCSDTFRFDYCASRGTVVTCVIEIDN